MDFFRPSDDTSLLTAILPRRNASTVVESLVAGGGRNLIAVNARGTLMRDRWYQSFLPVLSPEQEVVQMLIPTPSARTVMEGIIAVGQLNLSGAGAIFAMDLKDVWFGREFPQCAGEPQPPGHREDVVQFNRDLVSITCIVQREASEGVARAAVQAGAHGPTIYRCEGRGLRDQLMLLRITKSPEKEMVVVVVDACDADPVMEAMARAGRVTEPARGFIYQSPIARGLVNVNAVYGPTRHSASMQQVISAIDQLQGSAEWRTQNVVEVEEISGSRFPFSLGSRLKKRRYLHDLESFTVIGGRKYSEAILDIVLEAGAPAASVTFGRFVEAGGRTTKGGVRLNRERAIVQSILPPHQVPAIRQAVLDEAGRMDFHELAVYSFPVAKALTYLGED